jgi:hypothetical protein
MRPVWYSSAISKRQASAKSIGTFDYFFKNRRSADVLPERSRAGCIRTLTERLAMAVRPAALPDAVRDGICSRDLIPANG